MPPEEIIDPVSLMFQGSSEEPTPIEEVEAVEEVAEETVEEEVEVEQQEEETEETEIDYDKPPAKKKEVVEDDKQFANDTVAVRQAKEEGSKRKALEAEKREWELERDRLQNELETIRAKASELEATRIDPSEHPEYKEKLREVQLEVEDAFLDFKAVNKDTIRKELPEYLAKYREANSSDSRVTKLTELKDELAVKMFGEEFNGYDDLDKIDKDEVSKMVKFLKTTAKKADDLNQIFNTIDERAKDGTLAVGVREYEEKVSRIRPVIDAIGDLPDEVEETNPHGLEALIGGLVKTSDGKKFVNGVKKDVVDLLYGLPPLTEPQLLKIKANGDDVKSYMVERQKAFDRKKEKLTPVIIQALIARSSYKELAEELAGFKMKKASAKSEEDALLKTTKKKAPSVKEEKQVDPIEIMFKGA